MQLADLGRYLDPDGLTRTVAELEGRMGAPGFWDDQQKAAAISAKHSRATRRLESYRSLEADITDVEELAELARHCTEQEDNASTNPPTASCCVRPPTMIHISGRTGEVIGSFDAPQGHDAFLLDDERYHGALRAYYGNIAL